MARKILIVDDDPHIRDVIHFALDKAGLQTCVARDGTEALTLFARERPDLIVLDINMPELDGLEVCRELRKTSEVPILFLSSRDEEIDRIVGLEIGGDDYVTKPFSPRELVARVNAILKRLQPPLQKTSAAAPLEHGQLRLEPHRHRVSWAGQEIRLTATEFSILKGFLRQPDRVFDRDTIIESAYDMNVHVSDRTIDSHIRHIRSKFLKLGCESLIETVHGVGYRLGACR
ncbi:MAG: response regulator transcription factor [Hyphomicrobiales bacterium]|nr:response regulator transcription factor [Hyphomicrobiales bacterium]